MTVETQLPYDKEYITQYSERRNEPQWFRDLRLKAAELAEDLPMPKLEKTRIRDWNFTSFKHDVEGAKVENYEELPEKVRVLLGEKSTNDNLIIVRNNDVAYASLSKELEDQGVIFKDIFTAMSENEDLVKKYFMQEGVSVDENKLTARHAALLNSGVFLYVPKNVKIEKPVQVVFWQEDPEAALFNHVLLVADQNSEVTYVENYVSQNKTEQSVANIVSEVFALDNAKVSYGAVDNFEKGTTTYVNRRGTVGRDATLEWALGQMNDGNTISENLTHLLGDNGVCNAKSVSVGRGDQKQDFTAKIVNHGKETDGYILQHGVMKDNASSILMELVKLNTAVLRLTLSKNHAC